MYLNLVDALSQQLLIREDPWYVIGVIIRTVVTKFEYYLQGMIGIFGWLDFRLHPFWYGAFCCFVGIILYRTVEGDKKRIRWWQGFFLMGIIILTLCLQFYHFYTQGTPVAAPVMDSFQGRYLLPLVLFFSYAFSQLTQMIGKRKIMIGLCIFFAIGLGGSVIFNIYNRYFNYSKVFIDSTVFPKELDVYAASISLSQFSQYRYEVKSGFKTGGFRIAVKKTEDRPVTVSYQYRILDGRCMTLLHSGYLDQTQLQQTNVITIFIPVLLLTDNTLCMEFIPRKTFVLGSMVSLFAQDNKPIVDFLYLSQ